MVRNQNHGFSKEWCSGLSRGNWGDEHPLTIDNGTAKYGSWLYDGSRRPAFGPPAAWHSLASLTHLAGLPDIAYQENDIISL